MIEVENLTKRYGAVTPLDGVSFSVPEGEVLGFLGPNGAGKTTTMRILVGLSRPTRGSARIAGLDVQRDHLRIRRMLGFVPEDAPQYPEMRVDAYLRFMASMKLLPPRTIASEIDRVLAETDLQGWRRRLVGNLSKGTRQRLGIAQALLGDPRVLILDEPTVGLDPSQISEVRDLIGSMKGRRTVIFSTHILPNVAAACTQVVILCEGRILAQGSPAEIGAEEGRREMRIEVRGDEGAAREAVAAALAGFKPQVETRPTPGGWRLLARFSGEGDPRPAVARALIDRGLELLELREERATLEEVFLRVISGAPPREDAR